MLGVLYSFLVPQPQLVFPPNLVQLFSQCCLVSLRWESRQQKAVCSNLVASSNLKACRRELELLELSFPHSSVENFRRLAPLPEIPCCCRRNWQGQGRSFPSADRNFCCCRGQRATIRSLQVWGDFEAVPKQIYHGGNLPLTGLYLSLAISKGPCRTLHLRYWCRWGSSWSSPPFHGGDWCVIAISSPWLC
jgi:hypothetical protein